MIVNFSLSIYAKAFFDWSGAHRYGGQVRRLWDRLKPMVRSLDSALSLQGRVLKLVLVL